MNEDSPNIQRLSFACSLLVPLACLLQSLCFACPLLALCLYFGCVFRGGRRSIAANAAAASIPAAAAAIIVIVVVTLFFGVLVVLVPVLVFVIALVLFLLCFFFSVSCLGGWAGTRSARAACVPRKQFELKLSPIKPYQEQHLHNTPASKGLPSMRQADLLCSPRWFAPQIPTRSHSLKGCCAMLSHLVQLGSSTPSLRCAEVPLLWGPVRRLWEHEPADGDIGDLEQQFQVAPEDPLCSLGFVGTFGIGLKGSPKAYYIETPFWVFCFFHACSARDLLL